MSTDNRGSAVCAIVSSQARPSLEDYVVSARLTGRARSQRMLRVGIADDCQDAADSLSLLVCIWGHEVRVVYSGTAALELAPIYQPDVMLLDIAMPHMHGLELAQRLRRQLSIEDTLLVAITGYADNAHRQLGAAAGFDVYLAKPVESATLQQLLKREEYRCVEKVAACRRAAVLQ